MRWPNPPLPPVTTATLPLRSMFFLPRSIIACAVGSCLPDRRESSMSDIMILRGSHLLTDPRLKAKGLIEGGAIAIKDGLVAETGTFAALAVKYPAAKVLGDGTQLLLPGLV